MAHHLRLRQAVAVPGVPQIAPCPTSPSACALLLLDLPLFEFGERWARRPPLDLGSRITRQSPPLAEPPEPPNTDTPASGQLADGLSGYGHSFGLPDEPGKLSLGETRHASGGRRTESRPPPGPPFSSGGRARFLSARGVNEFLYSRSPDRRR